VGVVSQHDIALDLRQLVGELLQQWHKGQIDHGHAVFGMVHDPHDLIGKQPRIDSVIDRAHASDAVPAFKMAGGVPGERSDAVTDTDALAIESFGESQRPRVDRRVGGGRDRPLD